MNHHKLMFEAAPLAIVAIDEFGIVQDVNPAALELLGYDQNDLVGQNVSKMIPEPHRSHHDEYISNYIRTGKASIIGLGREVPVLKKDATEIPAFLSVSAYQGDDGKLRFIGFIKDISERVEAETRLRISERLASVGEMSSSIAHEIANPLTVIMGVVEHLLKQSDSPKSTPAQIKDSMSRILRMTERISKITTNVRKFARDASGDPKSPIAVSELFNSVQELCSHRADRVQVRIKIEPPEAGLTIFVRETEICQALVNLVNNGVDAAALLQEKWVNIKAEKSGESILIRVTDSGKGVSPEMRLRLGQKLFTTKPSGKGSGLGLYLARRNIENHGGKICIDHDQPNTTFVVELPNLKSA
jgi:two-component system sensor kinase FixL